jgi:hypothetical protein
MIDIITSIFKIYDELCNRGFNPLASIFVFIITEIICNYFPKIKGIYTLVTAIVIGIGFTVGFAFLFNNVSIEWIVINSLINFSISVASKEIMKKIQLLLPKDKQDEQGSI